MTSIRGFAEAIQDGAIDDTDQAADVIIAEARRLERLVGDLLDLTKLEAHQMSISLRPTDAAEVVADHRRGVPSGRSEERSCRSTSTSATTRTALGRPAASVAADPDRLAQLLANLIENAITYADTVVAVGLTSYPEAGVCLITVDDDGPGIAEARPEPRVRTLLPGRPRAQPSSGSGLGLAIVAELAAAMGGSVRAESPLGPSGGSRFVVTLGYWRGAVPELARV